MGISERLLRYGLQPRPVTEPASPTSPPDLPGEQLATEFSTLLGGRVVEGPAGSCWLAEQYVPLDARQGTIPLGSFAQLAFDAIAWLTHRPELGDLAPDEVAFFDTETTGLAGGTGTSIFLAGVASLSGGVFHLRQYFLHDPGAEPAFLTALQTDLSRYRAVMTFNGGRFDVPLLETRLVLNQQRVDWPFLHVDLLHPARRLWRRSVASCALETLEREVLAASRELDVPGWEIPGRYFAYLHGRRFDLLHPVFAHNASDLLTLAALSVRMTLAVETDLPGPHRVAERLGLATIHEKRGEWESAALQYELALAEAEGHLLQSEVLQRLGAAYKRLRNTEKAVSSWEAILESTSGQSVLAAIELAKYYEHRERDYARALALAERALLSLRRWSAPGDQRRTEILHRIARLRRKLGLTTG